jgi:hypothetical protein
MLATPVIAHSGSRNGPRPINPRRDIRQVLELLDLAFGPILDVSGRRILDTRASFQYQASFAMRLNLSGKGLAPGFVWEESGRIIGNVSLVQSDLSGRFLIASHHCIATALSSVMKHCPSPTISCIHIRLGGHQHTHRTP